MYDIIIVGGGPAGLTAAIYARRANKSVLVIEKETFGGQITFSPKVENIPGFISLSGNEFAERLVDQALSLEVEMEAGEVIGIENGSTKTVITEDARFEGRSVIIATGAKHRLLGLENEESYIGNGISFCAVCDGAFYADMTVCVIGGGNSALQEAILLADIAKKVYIIQNLPTLTGEKKLQEQLGQKDNVEIICSSVVDSYLGDGEIRAIRIKTGDKTREIETDGVFLAVGLIPQNEAFSGVLSLDERGYAKVDENMASGTDGIFVAGDCRQKRIRQVTTAASDGAVAALMACDWLDNRK